MYFKILHPSYHWKYFKIKLLIVQDIILFYFKYYNIYIKIIIKKKIRREEKQTDFEFKSVKKKNKKNQLF